MPVRFLPDERWHEPHDGETVLQVAERAQVPIERVCGGRGTCGKCRVVVLAGELSAVTETEMRTLSTEELRTGYRLACQARPAGTSSVTLRIPDEARRETLRILSAGAPNGSPVSPWVTRHHLDVPAADLANQIADLDAVARACRDSGHEAPTLNLSALRQLPDRSTRR